MQLLRITVISIGVCATSILAAQEPSGLAIAKAIDQEILKLNDLPDDVRRRAIKDLALSSPSPTPSLWRLTLPSLQLKPAGARLCKVTNTLADALQTSPNLYRHDGDYVK